MSTTYIQVCDKCGKAAPVYNWNGDYLCHDCSSEEAELVHNRATTPPPAARTVCGACEGNGGRYCPYCGGRGSK